MYSFKNQLVSSLKGVVVALIFSLISVLIFALIIEISNVPLNAIKPINLVLKILAVFLGVLVGVKDNKPLIRGFILGAIIIFVSFLLFGTIGGEISFSLGFLWELLLGGFIGAISGVVALGLKK